MFAMLDYRANKLFRTLWMPIRIVGKLLHFVAIAVASFLAQSTSYSTLVKIVIAYVVYELICLIIFQVILALAFWAYRRVFFWFVDVVPKHGANHEEALAIAVGGRVAELDIKLMHDIANWTPEDTYESVSLMNWRARLFFGGKLKIRMQRTVRELQRIHEETGEQPIELGIGRIAEVRKQVPGGDVSWFEYAIIGQAFFNSIIAIILIVVVIGYAAS